VGYVVFFACLIAVMGFCATINVAIERFAYRRLRRAPKLAPLITAVGVSFILQFIGIRWNGSGPKSWNSVLPDGEFIISGVHIAYTTIFSFAVTIPILALMTYIVTKTRRGKAMRATAQDADAARLMGINVNKTIAFTFALGGALAGAAGLLFQQTRELTNYNLGYQLGLIAFTSAVLGGIGNLSGAVLGAILIGLVQGLNDGLPIGLGQQWSQTVVFSILILLMTFRPTGLLGKPMVEKV
jgi:branched-chain amino acid transport system permease protein